MRTKFIEQTRRDWDNIVEAARERPLDTLLGIVITVVVAVLFAAPWLMD